jgi:glycopeptide antibiotics resistance protein
LQPFKQILGFLNYLESEHTNVNLWGNIFMFMPVGFGVPLLWHFRRPLVAGSCWTMAFSVFIELFQFMTPRVTDVDDVILNTLGGLLGALVYLSFQYYIPKGSRRVKKRPD